jgi:excisionase family DNA binding protein
VNTLDPILESVADRIAAMVAAKLADKPADKLMTVTEAAAYLGCSKQQIRNLVKLGELKKARGFTDTRLRRSVLDAYGK